MSPTPQRGGSEERRGRREAPAMAKPSVILKVCDIKLKSSDAYIRLTNFHRKCVEKPKEESPLSIDDEITKWKQVREFEQAEFAKLQMLQDIRQEVEQLRDKNNSLRKSLGVKVISSDSAFGGGGVKISPSSSG